MKRTTGAVSGLSTKVNEEWRSEYSVHAVKKSVTVYLDLCILCGVIKKYLR